MGLILFPLFLVQGKFGTQQLAGRIAWRENTEILPGNVGIEEEFSNVVSPGRMVILINSEREIGLQEEIG